MTLWYRKLISGSLGVMRSQPSPCAVKLVGVAFTVCVYEAPISSSMPPALSESSQPLTAIVAAATPVQERHAKADAQRCFLQTRDLSKQPLPLRRRTSRTVLV